MPEFAPVMNVSALNGANGFRLDGDAANDYSGRAVAGGGDINGDGFADILIGAPLSDTGGGDRGLAWVVFGAAAAPAAQGLAARVSAGTAYRFQGEAAGDKAGFSIANAGDVNGDGFDDLIIGAVSADPDAANGDRGASYLVFGGAANLEAADAADTANDNLIELASLTSTTGFRFDGGINLDRTGYSVSGAGDVNGDGIADLVIGAPYASPDGGFSNGASYIVFGGANLTALDGEDGTADGQIDLSNISAGQGLRLDGRTNNAFDRSGQSVALVGDVNGDGFDDVLVGSSYADPNSTGVGLGNDSEGAAWLVFGRPQAQFTAADLDLASLTGLEGTRFDGAFVNDSAGRAVAALGDVNGDGFADIVIGAPYANPGGTSNGGSAYVVFGKNNFGASSDLSALTGANGFRLDGLQNYDDTGFFVSAAGDVNGDGFADILVGARGFDGAGTSAAGAAYVVFGKASGFAAAIDLGSLDGNTGFRIEGAADDDLLGRSVAAAGDVNGDGFADLIAGASNAGNNALNDSGSTYIIYGHRADTAVTRTGTALDNRMNGGMGNDTINGLGGNDELIGWEGADRINGGTGNDTIDAGAGIDTILASAGIDMIDGGADVDLLDCSLLGLQQVVVNLTTGQFSQPGTANTATLTNIENVRGALGNDTIAGNGGANLLTGLEGNDVMNGAAGNDLLEGGLGRDTMIGGGGSDRFIFRAIAESGAAAATRDIISGFTVNPAAGAAFVDRIDLGVIDAQAGTAGAQAFTFIAGAAFTAEGQVRAVQSGAHTVIEINTAGVGVANMTIQLSNFTATNLTAADFIL
ncbi:MAG: hypothetical protein ACKVP5_12485 [Aestuariivirga sp.]